MKNSKICKLILLMVLVAIFVPVSAQKTYLFHPFYRDDISNVGLNWFYTNKQEASPSFSLKDGCHGYSILGVIKNHHWGYGFGLHWSINLLELGGFGNKISFFEGGFYSTLHLDFKLPFSNNVALGVHTGPGLSFSYLGYRSFRDENGDFIGSDYPFKDDLYKRFNFTYDVAVYIEYLPIRFEVCRSFGLTNHGTEQSPLKRDRLMIGIVWFGFE